MLSTIIAAPSPNYDDRPDESEINMLVMHYTGMQSGKDALNRMRDPQAKVSAHYMVEEDGSVFQLVPENKRAWHAGISCWRGRAALNDTSVGIEIVNPGHEFGYRPFSELQMQSVVTLAQEILSRHPIPARNVVGHSDIAPNRKQDPGELFNWEKLAEKNIGLWPHTAKVVKPEKTLLKIGDQGKHVHDMQVMLAEYGYHLRIDGNFGEKTQMVVTAFKRHFVPEQVSGEWDMLAQARMVKLLAIVGSRE